MRPQFICALLALGAASLRAQASAMASAPSAVPQKPQVHSSKLGFSYSLPGDWDVVDNSPLLRSGQKPMQRDAATDAEKHGINCARVALTAKRGSPASVIAIVALPFDCYGEQISDKALPGFAQGAMVGIDDAVDVSEPTTTTYQLSTHSVWIERSRGSLKGHAENVYTVETVCTVLKKSAVCWVAMAATADALAAFEGAAVQLDGYAIPALVPPGVFAKKP
jgi:hypothetical protein